MTIKSYRILFFFTFIVNFPCFGQTLKIDSIKNALVVSADYDKVNCLNALSKELTVLNRDTSFLLAKQASQIAETLHYTKGLATSYHNIAWIMWIWSDDYPGMEIYCKKAIDLLESTTEKALLAHSWFLLGCTYLSQCKFSFSLESFENARKYYLTSGDELSAANMWAFMADVEEGRGQYERSIHYSIQWLDVAKKHNSIRYLDIWATLYKKIGDFESALNYYQRAAQNAKATNNLDQLTWFTYMTGETFLLQKNYDSAQHYYQLAIKYSPPNAALNPRLADVYIELKKYDTALMVLNKSLIHSKKSGNYGELMWIISRLSKLHKETGDTKTAAGYAQELLRLAKEKEARQYIKDAHFLLFQLFDPDNKDSAYFHLQQYIVLKDSIDKDLSAQKLAFYKTKDEREKALSGISLLHEEKKIQQFQLKQSAQQKVILASGIGLLLLISAVSLRNNFLKRRNEWQKMEHKLKLQQLENEIESQRILFHERLRISRELHDDIGSTLGSISIYSEVAKKRNEKNENNNEVLSKIGFASRELIDKMSDIVWSLNAENESFEQLQNRMMAFSAMILVPRNINYDFFFDEELKNLQLPGEQRKNIFLIFKEALHNIVKYAECKVVCIKMFLQNDMVTMIIKDDGKGFNTHQTSPNEICISSEYLGGNGVKNMKARAKDINATLCISSIINKGTTIQLLLQL